MIWILSTAITLYMPYADIILNEGEDRKLKYFDYPLIFLNPILPIKTRKRALHARCLTVQSAIRPSVLRRLFAIW